MVLPDQGDLNSPYPSSHIYECPLRLGYGLYFAVSLSHVSDSGIPVSVFEGSSRANPHARPSPF